MRMGFPKALLPIKNEPAVFFLSKCLSRLGLKTFVSLPKLLLRDRFLCEEIRLCGAEVLENRYDSLGYSGSIRSIFFHAPKEALGLFVLPVDAPYINAELLHLMLNFIRSHGPHPLILLPQFYALSGHPVYFSHHFFIDLQNLEEGPRLLIKRHKKCVHSFLWPDARILANLNFPHHYCA